MFPETNDLYWGWFLTQISPEDLASGKVVKDMDRELLAFLRGQFKGALLRRPTVSSEGYFI